MAVDTYDDLVAEIPRYLKGRTDLTDRIPSFIDLAEKRINRALRIDEMIQVGTLTAASEITLPTDFLEVDAVVYEQEPRVVLTNAGKRAAIAMNPNSATGIPQLYRVRNQTMLLHPSPQSAENLTIEYYARPVALSSSNQTNTIFPICADIYLWAVLAEASLYLLDDVRAKQWDSRAQAAIEEANKAAARRQARGARVSRAYGAQSV